MTDAATETTDSQSQNTSGSKPAHLWKPGQSGNPGGRPKSIHKVQELARSKTEAMIGVLEEIAASPKAPPAARVAAANSILDRGWGKSSQPIGGADDLPPLSGADMKNLTTAQLEAIAAMAVTAGDQSAD